ncbi:MAG: hypothetical protein ACSHX9_12745 [Luteolibacter sp.]
MNQSGFKRLGIYVVSGLVLGVACSFLGLGAGGAMFLSVITGTLWILMSGSHQKVLKTFCYCFSISLGFWVFGFDTISDPTSIHTLSIFLAMILIPTGLSALIAAMTAKSKTH